MCQLKKIGFLLNVIIICCLFSCSVKVNNTHEVKVCNLTDKTAYFKLCKDNGGNDKVIDFGQIYSHKESNYYEVSNDEYYVFESYDSVNWFIIKNSIKLSSGGFYRYSIGVNQSSDGNYIDMTNESPN